MNEIKIQPNIKKVLEGLQSSGYNLNTALSDLIDNSIDAKATRIDIKFDIKEGLITILDNGIGMDDDTLKEAIRIGSDVIDDNRKLGKFGYGLKTASLSLSDEFHIFTKHEALSSNILFSKEEIIKKNEWIATRSTLDNRELDEYQSGTIIVMNKLRDFDNIKEVEDLDLRRKLREHIGLFFINFIKGGLKIYLNQIIVKPFDPFQEDKHFMRIQYNEEIIFNRIPMRVKIIVLPPISKIREAINPKEISSNGMFFFRNDRLISNLAFDVLKIDKTHLKRIKVKIDFDERMDPHLNINYQKSSISLSNSLKQKLITALNVVINNLNQKTNNYGKRLIKSEGPQLMWNIRKNRVNQLNFHNKIISNFVGKFNINKKELNEFVNIVSLNYPEMKDKLKDKAIEECLKREIEGYREINIDNEKIKEILLNQYPFSEYINLVISAVEED